MLSVAVAVDGTLVAVPGCVTGFDPVLATRREAMSAGLGPGRLSIDARIFGWKRIDAPTAQE